MDQGRCDSQAVFDRAFHLREGLATVFYVFGSVVLTVLGSKARRLSLDYGRGQKRAKGAGLGIPTEA